MDDDRKFDSAESPQGDGSFVGGGGREVTPSRGAATAHIEQRLVRTLEEVNQQQRVIHDLNKRQVRLANELALTKWKLASTTSRKWWRIGAALGRARSSLRGMFLFPRDLIRILSRPSRLPQRPEPQRAALYTGVSDADAGNTTFANPRGRSVASRVDASRDTDCSEGDSLLPLLVVAPSSMSLAPPPVSTTGDLRVACILDEMSYQSFEPECSLIRFGTHNWVETLEREMPNLLFVESAWRGNSGSWEYKVGSYDNADSVGLPDLTALVRWFQREGIPTVFWNKEDPIHFEKFKEAAALFDIVFTTDADMHDRYRELPGPPGRVVGTLPFAAQPAIHNPVASLEDRDPLPVFAGAYYRNRHEARRAELDMLLDAALPFGLVIYDRMGGAVSESFGFPERYRANIAGTLAYDDMARTYRRHRVFLNVNSVNRSPSMFSRRVFELLASGTPVVSTPSVGLEQMFGDVVSIVETPWEAREAVRRLIEDDEWWFERSVAGIDAVFRANTYGDRLETIANTAGLGVHARAHDVALIVTDDIEVPAEVLEALGTDVEILTSTESGMDGSRVRRVVLPTGIRPSDLGRVASHATTSEWLAFVSSEEDLRKVPGLITATRVAPAELYVGSAEPADVHRYVRTVPDGGAIVASREFVRRSSWAPDGAVDAIGAGARVYAVPIPGG